MVQLVDAAVCLGLLVLTGDDSGSCSVQLIEPLRPAVLAELETATADDASFADRYIDACVFGLSDAIAATWESAKGLSAPVVARCRVLCDNGCGLLAALPAVLTHLDAPGRETEYLGMLQRLLAMSVALSYRMDYLLTWVREHLPTSASAPGCYLARHPELERPLRIVVARLALAAGRLTGLEEELTDLMSDDHKASSFYVEGLRWLCELYLQQGRMHARRAQVSERFQAITRARPGGLQLLEFANAMVAVSDLSFAEGNMAQAEYFIMK